MIAAGFAPGRSSESRNQRPAIGFTPSILKRSAETRRAVTSAGGAGDGPAICSRVKLTAARVLKLRA